MILLWSKNRNRKCDDDGDGNDDVICGRDRKFNNLADCKMKVKKFSRMNWIIQGIFMYFFLTNYWINGKILPDENGPLSEVQTAVGLEVSMPCDLMPGTIIPDITDKVTLVIWYKEGNTKPIYTFDARGKSYQQATHWFDIDVLKTKAMFFYDSNPPALRIKNVERDDAGLYRCRVDFQKSPTRNWRINMTVLVPPTQLIVLDTYGAAVTDNIVGPYNTGANINLTCLSSGGVPAPRVSWWKEHALLDDTYQVLPDGTVRNVLQLHNITRSDLMTIFTCQASNGHVLAPLSSAVRLDMNLPPLYVRLQGLNHPLIAGVRTQITCSSAGARPSPQIIWNKGGVMMRGATQSTSSDGNTTISELILIPVPEDNEKQVSCSVIVDSQQQQQQTTTGNGVFLKDSRTLDVKHAPIVSLNLGAPLDPNNLMKGSDVYLECDIKANPPAKKVEWYHNDKQLHSSRGIIISNQTLVLQGISKTTHGQYFCRASNMQGTVSSNEVYLDVKYPPVCKSESTIIRAALKQVINITCQVDSNPIQNLTYKWNFNNSLETIIELPPLQQYSYRILTSSDNINDPNDSSKDMDGNSNWSQSLSSASSSSSSSSLLIPSGKPSEFVNNNLAGGGGVGGESNIVQNLPYSQMVYSNLVYQQNIDKNRKQQHDQQQGQQQQQRLKHHSHLQDNHYYGNLNNVDKKRRYSQQQHQQQHQLQQQQQHQYPPNNVYRYRVESFTHFGTVSCIATNMIGQSQPCLYHITPAELPDPVKNCTAYNATANSIQVFCLPGNDGGIQQHFHVEVYDELNRQVLYNTSYRYADFTIKRLPSDSVFVIRVTSYNLQGFNNRAFRLRAKTLSAPLLRTASSTAVLVQLTPLLGALVGVVATLMLVAVCIVIFIKFRTKHNHRRTTGHHNHHHHGDTQTTEADKGSAEPLSRNMGSHSSLEDKNPDVIPQENSEDEFNLEEKAFDRLNMESQRILYTPPRLNSTSPPPLSPSFAKQYGELSLTTNPSYALYNSPQRAPATQRPIYTAPPPLLSTRTPPNIYTRIPSITSTSPAGAVASVSAASTINRAYLPAYETRTSPTSPYGSTLPLLGKHNQQKFLSATSPLNGSTLLINGTLGSTIVGSSNLNPTNASIIAMGNGNNNNGSLSPHQNPTTTALLLNNCASGLLGNYDDNS